VADTPVISLATEPSLMPADSSDLPRRWISEVRAWTVLIRYAEARIMPSSQAACRRRVVAGVKTSA